MSWHNFQVWQLTCDDPTCGEMWFSGPDEPAQHAVRRALDRGWQATSSTHHCPEHATEQEVA